VREIPIAGLRLLATTWLLEPDQPALDRLARIPELAEVATGITPEAAALEYSRVVLQMVPPYASLFLDEDAMLNGPHTERVEMLYRQAGFSISREWRAGPADHLGIEMHFLAHLLEADDGRAGRFLAEYLLPWAPVCLLAISRIESASLYPALANVTLEVLLGLHGEAG
jgi:TorA maturation chaperone TorD